MLLTIFKFKIKIQTIAAETLMSKIFYPYGLGTTKNKDTLFNAAKQALE